MDDILHMESITGLANILADDSLDPSMDEQPCLDQRSIGSQRSTATTTTYSTQQHNFNDSQAADRGRSKFSQFFQQQQPSPKAPESSQQTLSLSQFLNNGKADTSRHEEKTYQGTGLSLTNAMY